MAVVNPPWTLQATGQQHTAKLFRRMLQGMLGEGLAGMNIAGVTTWPFGLSGDLAVSAHGPNNMSVDVAKGGCYIFGDDTADQGIYFVYNDATINPVIAASDPTNPRIDIIVARVKDNTEGQAGDVSSIEVITGTPAGSPVAPAVPNTALKLAEVRVNATVTSIVPGNITDFRAMATDVLLTRQTPSVKVYRNSAFNVLNTGSTIGFDAEVWDTDGFHDNVTNNSRLTVPNGLGGKYLIEGAIGFAPAATIINEIRINRNAAGLARGPSPYGNGAASPVAVVSTVAQLNAGEYVELFATTDATRAVVLGEQYTWLSAIRMG